MDLHEVFLAAETEILDEAADALQRSHVRHYESSGPDWTRERLAELMRSAVASLRERTLQPITQHAEAVAEQRFTAGFDIFEVQTGFNVLEEAMWRHVVATTPPDQLACAIGLLGTVLGAGKDALARRYVSLASHKHVPSLDLRALFGGTSA